MKYKKIIFVISFLAIFGFLFSFGTQNAEAMTVAEIQALIQQLQAQIAALQQQLAEAEGTPAVWCYDFNTNLRIGDSNPEVLALQTALQKEGLLNQTTKEFDEETASAVVGLQEKYASEILTPWGLKHGTGFVGAATRTKLNNLYRCGAIPTTPTTLTTTTAFYLSITNVSGIKSTYAPGEKIFLTIKGVESDGTPASAAEGYNIQSYIFDSKRTKTYAGVNGSYNSSNGLWNVVLTAPTDTSLTYDLQVSLYCSNTAGGCIRSSTSQVDKWYSFTLSASSVQPSIAVISPNGGERWQIGKTYTITWGSSNMDKLQIALTDANLDVGEKRCVLNGGSLISETPKSFTFTLNTCVNSSGQIVNVSPGNYKIRICGQNEGYPCDYSDNYFSIVAATVACTDSDGGKEYYKKGIVTESGKTYADYCFEKTSDNCVKEPCDNWVKEYFCLPYSTVNIGLGGVAEEDYKCPNGCKDGACLATTTPSITVLSPNGGEKWAFGSAYNITWKASGIDIVNIELEKWAGDDGQVYAGGPLTQIIDENISVSLGFYSWPLGHLKGGTIASTGSYYRIRIVKTGDTSSYYQQIADVSNDYFSIVAATALPDIQITDITPVSVVQNQFTNYIATIKNNSSQNITTPFVVNLGGTATTISSLAAWQTTTVNASFGLSILGPNEVCAVADIWNTVAESNESNNTFCKTVNVVTASASSITVTSPNGGEKWEMENTYEIKWNASSYSSGSTVQIGLRDTRYDPNLASGEATIVNTTNIGSYSWTIPKELPGMTLGTGNVYKIVVYIEGGGTGKFDYSDNYFSIVSAITCTDSDGGTNYYVKGTTQGKYGAAVDFCRDDNNWSVDYCDGTKNCRVHEYFCGAYTAGTDDYINSMEQLCPYGCKDGACLPKPSITVVSPNGGEKWIIGQTYQIKWSSKNVNHVRIYIEDDTIAGSGSTNYIYNGAIPAQNGYYDWTIVQNQLPGYTLAFPRTYYLRIDGVNDVTIGSAVVVSDKSDNYFSIAQPTVKGTITPTMSCNGSCGYRAPSLNDKLAILYLLTNGSEQIKVTNIDIDLDISPQSVKDISKIDSLKLVRLDGVVSYEATSTDGHFNFKNLDIMLGTVNSAGYYIVANTVNLGSTGNPGIMAAIILSLSPASVKGIGQTSGEEIIGTGSTLSVNLLYPGGGGTVLENIENQLASISAAISKLMEEIKKLIQR